MVEVFEVAGCQRSQLNIGDGAVGIAVRRNLELALSGSVSYWVLLENTLLGRSAFTPTTALAGSLPSGVAEVGIDRSDNLCRCLIRSRVPLNSRQLLLFRAGVLLPDVALGIGLYARELRFLGSGVDEPYQLPDAVVCPSKDCRAAGALGLNLRRALDTASCRFCGLRESVRTTPRRRGDVMDVRQPSVGRDGIRHLLSRLPSTATSGGFLRSCRRGTIPYPCADNQMIGRE